LREKKRLSPACVDFTHASRLLDIIVSLSWTSAKARKNTITNVFILCKAGGIR